MKRLRKLRLCCNAFLGNDQNIGILLPESIFDLFRVRAELCLTSEYMRSSVIKAVGIGSQIAGSDHNSEYYHHRHHNTAYKLAEALEGRHKGAVLRFIYQLVSFQYQRRHKYENSDKADSHALCQRKTKIRTYPELHQTQSKEADDRRKSAGKNRCG